MTGHQDAEQTHRIRSMFSAIAPTYDLLNRILSLGVDVRWRRTLVTHVPPNAGQVLDLACGTGDVALEIAAARPGCAIQGADFSLPMLVRARSKIRAEGRAPLISLQNASAEDLPYRDASFDAVAMAFGIRNVVRRDRALGEIRRVLRPGGVALILDFSLPRNAAVRLGYGFYFHRLLPLLGGLISGNFQAYRYLPRSVEGFPPRHEFVRQMEAQGFSPVACEDFTLGIATLYEGVRV